MQQEDPGTFISRAILLELIQEKKISWMKYGNAWLIHTKQVFKAINPRELEGNYETPRLRNRMSAVREWNKTHPYCQIDKHVIDACKQDERMFCYKRENTWVINYDQLEPVIAEYLLSHTYTPQNKR